MTPAIVAKRAKQAPGGLQSGFKPAPSGRDAAAVDPAVADSVAVYFFFDFD